MTEHRANCGSADSSHANPQQATAATSAAANAASAASQDAVASGGLLLLISGPAGSGKTTLCDRMLAEFPATRRVVTSTSRAPRQGEQHEVDYYFFSPEEFQRQIAADAFYEWAQVHGRYYGTLRSEIDRNLARGVDLLINVDVQGAETFRAVAASAGCPLHGRLVTVFVRPRNLDELRQRLHGRGTDDKAEIDRRMETACKELEHEPNYDHVIVSSDREADFAALVAIYQQECARRGR